MKLENLYKNALFVILFNGLILGCGLFKNIILVPYVSEAELGVYSLLLAISGFVYPLSLVGQQTALVRFLSGREVKSFNCTRGVTEILAVSAALIVLATAIAAKIYALTGLAVLFLVVVTFANAVTDLLPGVLRAQGIYAVSIVIFRGVNLFLLAGFVVLIALARFTLANVLWTVMLITAGYALVSAVISVKYFGTGRTPFPKYIWKEGAMLLGTHLSLLVIIYSDRLLIPKLVSLEALGLYFAISAVMRLFELATQSIEFVLLPDVHRLNARQMLLLAGAVVAGGIVLALAYVLFGPSLVALLYQGKYDAGVYLIPYLAMSGFLSILYVIPYTIISGRLPARCLQQLLYGNVAVMVLNIAAGFVLISRWELRGAALTTIIIWMIRVFLASGIIYFERRRGRLIARRAPG
ncbi:hypothetical protein HUU39_18545 [candidate division KSB1 bacterium]|nr:hypothetical protein [bacterium]NUM67242.1 hypothetical protein [candidate division KSB1 bacterium]